MSDESTPKRRSYGWYGIAGGLVVVIAIMTYAMFEMNRKLEAVAIDQNSDLHLPRIHVTQTPNSSIDPNTPIDLNPPFDANSWDPFQEMEAMQQRIDSMFNNAFGHFNSGNRFDEVFNGITHSPRLDLIDKGDRYVATLDIPGSNDSEINVSVDGQTLTVEGETTERSAQQGTSGQMLQEERHVGNFRRQITLPEPVDTSKKVETDYKDGVYTVTMYKLHPTNPTS